jgi:hypothetical protein
MSRFVVIVCCAMASLAAPPFKSQAAVLPDLPTCGLVGERMAYDVCGQALFSRTTTMAVPFSRLDQLL